MLGKPLGHGKPHALGCAGKKGNTPAKVKKVGGYGHA